MLFVENEPNKDPRINLAIEEYLIKSVAPKEEILMFYINKPSIIVGRNQNTIQEINVDYVQEHDIIVVRRLSGGGAVYHDLGNLNFSFIAPNSPGNFHNFRKFTQPVIKVLMKMGVPAELSGRNDILADGKKISGNAQYVSGPRMVSHGTLLWNTDLSVVGDALRVKQAKIESKGIKSVRSRVANITEYLPENPPDIMTFRQMIIDGVHNENPLEEYVLTDTDWENIHQLSKERYQTWEWNFGRSPAFNIQKTQRFPFGQIDARIEVQQGEIKHIKLFGDFLGLRDVSDVESRLSGVRYDKSHLQAALEGIELKDYLGGLATQEFVTFLFA